MEDNLPTRVIGWTYWGNPKFTDYAKFYGVSKELESIVADALKKNGYHWDGHTHQNTDFGVPVFDNDCIGMFSWREWGEIMALAYPDEADSLDKMRYCEWGLDPNNELNNLIKIPPESEWLS